MRMPWSTVSIFCANEEELENLLYWLSCQSLADMNKLRWQVTAIAPNRLNLEKGIQGYYVDVPWSYLKPRLEKLEPQEAMKQILEG